MRLITILFLLGSATFAAASDLTLTRPTFGWVPGLTIKGQTVIREIDAVVMTPQDKSRLLWMGDAVASKGNNLLGTTRGRVTGEPLEARFSWSAKKEDSALAIKLEITPDQSVPRGAARMRMVVPKDQIAGCAWQTGGASARTGRFDSAPPTGDHILLKANDGWFAWQIADERWLRLTPDPENIVKWQVQDNRKFGGDAFEIQLTGIDSTTTTPGQPIVFSYTLELVTEDQLPEAVTPVKVVDRGPDVAMLENQGPAEILSITRSRSNSELTDFYEFAIELKGDYTNPFDAQDIRLDAYFRHADGHELTVPGFFIIEYDRSENVAGDEEVSRTGNHGWRVRFRPLHSGDYVLTLTLNDGESVTQSLPFRFTASRPLQHAGFIQASASNPLALSVGPDEPFIPVGMNIAWPKSPGTYDYEMYWDRLSAAGGNFARVWLAPTFNRLALERPEVHGVPSSGLGRIDQRGAMRVDHLINLAETKSLRLMLCTESFGNFRSERKGSGQWYQSPYNVETGGILDKPDDFFTDTEARRLYRNRLRYIVARWGHSPSVFAWEFWNEVTYTDNFEANLESISLWHEEMSDYLHVIDPYQHLVTTSFGSPRNIPSIDGLPGIDLIQTHMYQVEDIPGTINRIAWDKADRYGKPHMFGELGTSQIAEIVSQDLAGKQIHEMLWAGLFTPTPATAMSWWWDSHMASADLWHLFHPISRYIENLPTARGELSMLPSASVAFSGPLPAAQPASVNLVGEVKTWDPGPSNVPTRITVAEDGSYQGTEHLSVLLHGMGNHPELHNPLTLQAEYRVDGDFVVNVRNVSGYGGGRLKIYLNEQLLLDEYFKDQDGEIDTEQPNVEPLIQYNGAYRVPVPQGSHSIRVVNDGADWIEVVYELNGINLSQTPWLDVQTLLIPETQEGEPAVLAWIRNRECTWQNAVAGKTPRPVPPSKLTLAGVPNGRYALEWFDTQTGQSTLGDTLMVGDGQARIDLPVIEHDIALRLLTMNSDTPLEPR